MKANAVAKGHKAPLSKRLKRDWHKNKWKYIMILPVLIYLFLFCYKPMYGLVIAFKDYKAVKGIAGSPWVTILFGFPAPIILALMINEVKNSAFKRTVQTITYMPYFISMVVLCGLLKTFCMQDGLFAQIAVLFGGKAQNYLANPAYFRTIYVLSDIWSGIGWNSIIYLAALSSIDQEQYEAARVDGANRFQQMLHITLPGLVPTIMVLFILRMGNILNVGYEKILLLYNSATYSTADVISTYTYRLSFGGSGNPMYSKSTAIGLFNTIINVFFLMLTNMISKKATDAGLF